MAELKTRITLRKDTEANWLLYNPVLLDGEVALVETSDGIKFKVGDGVKTFTQLSYIEKDVDINEETFVFEDDLVTNYTLGKYAGTLTNPQTIPAQGKTFKQVWNDIFKNVVPGTKTADPAATLTASGSGSFEVGTVKSTAYSASLSAGSYSYGPATGITAKTYSVSFNGTTKDTASGDFGDYTVADGTKTMSLSITYDAAPNRANKSDGSADASGVQIPAGTKTASKDFKGYRKMFYGTLAAKSTLTSAVIRGLTGVEVANTSGKDVTIPLNALRVVYAVPATKKVTSVKDKNGLGAEIFSSFSCIDVNVEGANSYTAIAYKVYYLDYANPNDKANTYTFKVENA